MTKICHCCRRRVNIPKKTEEDSIKCPYCGARAKLKRRKKNNKTRGLWQGFSHFRR